MFGLSPPRHISTLPHLGFDLPDRKKQPHSSEIGSGFHTISGGARQENRGALRRRRTFARLTGTSSSPPRAKSNEPNEGLIPHSGRARPAHDVLWPAFAQSPSSSNVGAQKAVIGVRRGPYKGSRDLSE
jgi:hypothetical protein